jgi:hypothetical protein
MWWLMLHPMWQSCGNFRARASRPAIALTAVRGEVTASIDYLVFEAGEESAQAVSWLKLRSAFALVEAILFC